MAFPSVSAPNFFSVFPPMNIFVPSFFLFREYFISFCNQTHVDKTLYCALPLYKWKKLKFNISRPIWLLISVQCQEVHADRSLKQLSSERLCQSMTNTEADARSQPLN